MVAAVVGARRTALDPAATEQRTEALAARLAERFTQYRDRPFERIMVLQLVRVTGWAATG